MGLAFSTWAHRLAYQVFVGSIPDQTHAEQDASGAFGPPPDYADPANWAARGTDAGPAAVSPPGFPKVPALDRAVDCFFVHPTNYCTGTTWNAPLKDAHCDAVTDVYLAQMASTFNETCRIYAPRYRQAILASFLHDETQGRAALDFAYQDVRDAFFNFLKDTQDRPLILAAHSQGTWHLLRLLQECVEGRPLMNRLVAVYCLGGWFPLDFFRGPDAIFRDLKLSDGADDVGCVIHWCTESSSRNAQSIGGKLHWGGGEHCEHPGHWKRSEYVSIRGKRIVGTHPLNWRTNSPEDSQEPYLGLLDPVAGLRCGETTLRSMKDLWPHLVSKKETGLVVKEAVFVPPETVDDLLGASFAVRIDGVTGELVTRLPEACGAESEGYHLMDFGCFWANIRLNVKVRANAFRRRAEAAGAEGPI